MIASVHQPQYLPWLGYFQKIYHSDVFVFLDDVQYKKREYQNRNRIRTKSGCIWLTVPVLKNEEPYPNISNVYIDNSRNWRRRHWRAIYLNYARAPFFKKYSDFFEDLYKKEWEKLVDLNIYIVKSINEFLGIERRTCLLSQLNVNTPATQRIINICKALKTETYLSGIGGKDYLEEDKFKDNSIELIYQNFNHPVYTQLYMKDKKDFVPYLSIIDLIFNHGPDSLEILVGRGEKVCVRKKD